MIKQTVPSPGSDVILPPSCRVSWIQRVVVVVAKENMDLMADIVRRFQHRRVRVVAGGSTRHRSISSGVLALGEEEEEEGQGRPAGRRPKVIIVHDAVRPFVEEDFLCQIAVAAKEHGVSVRAESREDEIIHVSLGVDSATHLIRRRLV